MRRSPFIFPVAFYIFNFALAAWRRRRGVNIARCAAEVWRRWRWASIRFTFLKERNSDEAADHCEHNCNQEREQRSPRENCVKELLKEWPAHRFCYRLS